MDNKTSIPLALKDATKRLNLTKWGQIKLICFPDEAIRHALLSYTSKTSFNTFFFKANEYCKDNSIEPDWALYYDLSKKHNMPDDPQFISKSSPAPAIFEVKEVSKYSSKVDFDSQETWKNRMIEKYGKELGGKIVGSSENIYTKFPMPGGSE